MFLRERSYWGSVALASYAGASAVTASPEGAHGAPLAGLLLVPVALAVGYAFTAAPEDRPDRVEPAARAAARLAITGAGVLIESATSRDGLLMFSYLGSALASVAGLVAVARSGSLGGLLAPPRFARRLDAAAVAAFAWSIAIALAIAGWVTPDRTPSLPLAVAYAGSAASIASVGLLLAAAGRALVARRLELGVSERLAATLWLGASALTVGIATSALGLSPPEKMLPALATITGVVAGAAAATQRADTIARVMRQTLALLILAAPPALLAAYAAKTSPDRAAICVMVACGACALVGMAAPRIARRAAPERHLWLDALDAATQAALSPDPESALEEALRSLRPLSGSKRVADRPLENNQEGGSSGTPTLFKLSPAEALTADRAGFVHRESAEVPESVLSLARGEPDQILRTDVLHAVSVRMPEVRSALAWLEDRSLGAVALLTERTDPLGLLALPKGERTAPHGLEEIHAFRALADRLAAVVAVASKIGRSWERERVARDRAEVLEARAEGLAVALGDAKNRVEDILTLVARPARLAVYSPASRLAIERIESLSRAQAPITLLAAPGIDALAYAAVCHLASPTPGGPFVVADGGSQPLTDLMLWRSASSPIERARGGTLLVLFPELLPKLVQSYIGAAADERVRLVVVVAKTIDVLVSQADLDERFADRVGDRVVALPTLASRSEDLRSLAIAHLGEIGARFHGRPIGIEAAALGMLAEHPWLGNDAELVGVLTRAATTCDGHIVRRKDISLAALTLPSPARSARR